MSHPTSKQLESSGSDEPKGCVRKTLEVTYTEIVEPSDGHHGCSPAVLPKRESPDPDLFTSSFVRVDSGIEGFHETVGRDKCKFQDACLEMLQPYVDRMEKVLGEVRKTEAGEKFTKLENDRETDKQFIEESLRQVLEDSRERQLRREQQLSKLLKHF